MINDTKVASMPRDRIEALLQEDDKPPRLYTAPTLYPPEPEANKVRYSISGSWVEQGKITGNMLADLSNGKGSFSLTAGPNRCKGHWSYMTGVYGSMAGAQGKWSMSCDNGTAASGVYRSRIAGIANVRGEDKDGHQVKMVFSLKP